MIDDDSYISLPTLRERDVTYYFRAIYRCLKVHQDAETVPLGVADDVAAALALGSKLARGAVRASLDDIVDRPWRKAAARRASYRLAVNKKRLSSGWACPYQPTSVGLHWAHAIITDVAHAGDVARAKPKLQVAYRVLSGRLAGSQVVEVFNQSFSGVLYRMCVGQSRGNRLMSALQLVSMRLGLRVQYVADKYEVESHGISKSVQAANLKLARRRIRDLYPCPFSSPLDCVLCKVGKNECEFSVRNEVTHFIRK